MDLKAIVAKAKAAEFEAAAKTIKSLPSVSNDDKLQLYALYKQATVGPAPESSNAGLFDIVGQQKYKAWDSVRKLKTAEAQVQYVALVAKLTPPSPAVEEEAQQPEAQQQAQPPASSLAASSPVADAPPRARRDSVASVLASVASSSSVADVAPPSSRLEHLDSRMRQVDQKLRHFGRQIAGSNSGYIDRSGTTFQIVTLLVSMACITFFGLVFHLADPGAGRDRAIELRDDPPPSPPPLPPLHYQQPSPPPNGQHFEWWQRRRPISEMVTAAWIELLLCVCFCCVLPVGCVWHRRRRVAHARGRDVLSRLGGSRQMRHAKLVEETANDKSAGARWKRANSMSQLSIIAAAKEARESTGDPEEVGTRV